VQHLPSGPESTLAPGLQAREAPDDIVLSLLAAARRVFDHLHASHAATILFTVRPLISFNFLSGAEMFCRHSLGEHLFASALVGKSALHQRRAGGSRRLPDAPRAPPRRVDVRTSTAVPSRATSPAETGVQRLRGVADSFNQCSVSVYLIETAVACPPRAGTQIGPGARPPRGARGRLCRPHARKNAPPPWEIAPGAVVGQKLVFCHPPGLATILFS